MKWGFRRNRSSDEAGSRGNCPSGKRSYLTKSAARRVIRYFKRRPDGTPKPQYAYRCAECGCWHLTSQDKSRQPCLP